jgi:hypothetical protein
MALAPDARPDPVDRVTELATSGFEITKNRRKAIMTSTINFFMVSPPETDQGFRVEGDAPESIGVEIP